MSAGKLCRGLICVYICFGVEKAIASSLEGQESETYSGLLGDPQLGSARRLNVELPLFPGYVFVKTSIARKARVLEHPGVIRFVGLPEKRRLSPMKTWRSCARP